MKIERFVQLLLAKHWDEKVLYTELGGKNPFSVSEVLDYLESHEGLRILIDRNDPDADGLYLIERAIPSDTATYEVYRQEKRSHFRAKTFTSLKAAARYKLEELSYSLSASLSAYPLTEKKKD